jgi:hypothetical protein
MYTYDNGFFIILIKMREMSKGEIPIEVGDLNKVL